MTLKYPKLKNENKTGPALGAMKELAMQLKEYNGLSSITGNEITSEYLKNLVNKKY